MDCTWLPILSLFEHFRSASIQEAVHLLSFDIPKINFTRERRIHSKMLFSCSVGRFARAPYRRSTGPRTKFIATKPPELVVFAVLSLLQALLRKHPEAVLHVPIWLPRVFIVAHFIPRTVFFVGLSVRITVASDLTG